ncbi:SGNH/GDSL hydrolase family protein [Paludibacter sp.]
MKTKIALLLILFSLFVYSNGNAQVVSKFKKGENVVFLGNSITDGGHYHSYIWLFYMTRFPDMPIRIQNAGIGGNTAADMLKRLDGDVFSKKPTTLVVTYGMNDSGYAEYNGENGSEFGSTKYNECIENSKKLEERLVGYAKAKIILLGSSPYDETAKIKDNKPLVGKNKVMQRIVDYQKETAKQRNWEFVDFNAPLTQLNEKQQRTDSAFTLSGSDRIHPGNDGHMVMAYYFLKAQDLDKTPVADVEIDANTLRTIKTENCKISKIKNDNNTLSFDYLAKSLPYPLDTALRYWSSKNAQSDVDRFVPFSDEMNREILKVTKLNGKYKLVIDNIEIGEWDGNELAKGINLAKETRTPQYQQALAIMRLNESRYEIERKFRTYEWIQYYLFEPKGLLYADNRESLDLLNSELPDKKWMKSHAENYIQLQNPIVRDTWQGTMDLIVRNIYQTNKPIKRHVMLVKQ